MSFAFKCDSCGIIYEHGFNGAFSKVIKFKKMSIDVELKMRPPHLCNKCLNSFMNRLAKEIKGTYR